MKEFIRQIRENGIWPWTHSRGNVTAPLSPFDVKPHTHDVPRTANGWPTIEPKFFTLDQLLLEAESWRNCGDHASTVGQSKWRLYTEELLNRGFMDESDIKIWKRRGMPTMTKTEAGWVCEFPPVSADNE